MKTDFKKELDSYRASSREVRIVSVPSIQYLMIDGHGDPNTTPAFAEAIESLYPVAFAVKFASRNELDRDYVVPPLEGLWWADDMAVFTAARDKGQWNWTLMIMVPDWIDRRMFDIAVDHVMGRKSPPPRDDLRLATLTEGQCVQTLHVGSFDAEAEALRQLHEGFIPDHELQLAGRHHEIYLSDFRRVEPERQRTILRQPVTTTSPQG